MKKIKSSLILMAISSAASSHDLPVNTLIHEPLVIYANPIIETDNRSYRLGVNTTQVFNQTTLNSEEIMHAIRNELHSDKIKRNIMGEGRVYSPPTHDIIDLDASSMAILAAMAHCDSTALSNPIDYAHGAVPVFTGPVSFIEDVIRENDAKAAAIELAAETGDDILEVETIHNYDINEGISFYCMALEVEYTY